MYDIDYYIDILTEVMVGSNKMQLLHQPRLIRKYSQRGLHGLRKEVLLICHGKYDDIFILFQVVLAELQT